MAAILLSMALIAPLLGHWLDKHSIRNTMPLGALLMGIGFACLSQAKAVWQMGLILVLFLGLGAAMPGQLPSSKITDTE
jgi:MFS family permease